MPKGGAAQAAFYAVRMDILYYLITHGYNVHSKFSELNFSDYSTIDVDICHKLRYCIYPIDSFQYKYKLLVINELSKRGMDYRSSKIPENASNYSAIGTSSSNYSAKGHGGVSSLK